MIHTSFSRALKMMPAPSLPVAAQNVLPAALSAIRFCSNVTSSEKTPSEIDLKATQLIRLGFLRGEVNSWEKAIEAYNEAINLQEASGSLKALANNNMGTIFYKRKINPQALECYKKAVELEEKTTENYKIYEENLENQKINIEAENIEGKNLKFKETLAFNDQGIEFSIGNKFDEAIQMFKQAITNLPKDENVESEKKTITENLAGAFFSRGEVLATEDDKQKALEHFAASLILNDKLGDKALEIKCCISNIANFVSSEASEKFCLEFLSEIDESSNFLDLLKKEDSPEELKKLINSAERLVNSSEYFS